MFNNVGKVSKSKLFFQILKLNEIHRILKEKYDREKQMKNNSGVKDSRTQARAKEERRTPWGGEKGQSHEHKMHGACCRHQG